MKFSKSQLLDFAAFVRVQKSGRFNMYDPRAAKAAGLVRAQMVFCMEHYEELARAAEAGEKGAA